MHAPISAAGALLLDRLFGEPQHLHPLVGFGRLAAAVELRLNNALSSAQRQRLSGVFGGALLVLPLSAACWLACRTPVIGPLATLILLYLALGGRSLAEHAQRVITALRANNLDEARQRVSYMVSRDTASMQGGDVARATVESVLENGNDAVFAALFWFLVAGAPGAVVYRLANTLDAMWGYRSPRYLHFGWAAARFDDLLNFIPARLTALTYAILGHTLRAWRCWRIQGRLWESPNAGPVMAAGAGALGIELGGPAFYHGVYKQRPALGEGLPATENDINRALTLVQRGVLLWLGLWFVAVLGGSRLA
ncbi:MAG: adenosylcobinamide-phosphate synthase CbiB [Acidiferrobacterales bacterium]